MRKILCYAFFLINVQSYITLIVLKKKSIKSFNFIFKFLLDLLLFNFELDLDLFLAQTIVAFNKVQVTIKPVNIFLTGLHFIHPKVDKI